MVRALRRLLVARCPPAGGGLVDLLEAEVLGVEVREEVGAVPGASRPGPQAAQVRRRLGDDDHEPGLHQADDMGPAAPHVLGLGALERPEGALDAAAADIRRDPGVASQ